MYSGSNSGGKSFWSRELIRWDLSIRIKNLPFAIIGVLEDKGESGMGQDQDDLIIAPYTTVQRRLAAIDYINGIYASAVS